ncbi:MAG: adenylate/guanylate cyclase domain-containing protein [Acidimicrobiia bacterium]|nr:adenylate/guanylate cyclase domain-containing protein [Acidimicrobiia bacterium]
MHGPPETRFTRSGGVDIAYQVVGDGDRDLVMTMGWVTNLDVMWELPELAGFLEALARIGRLVLFDKRGTGLSDRVSGVATLEERAEDVGSVMDAVGSEEAVLVGWGDGAAIAAMFASTYPARVSALVLSTLTVALREGSIVADPATMDAMRLAVERGWGDALFLPVVAPAHAGDPRIQSWWRRWERSSATPNAAAQLLQWGAQIDLRPVLPAVQAPTLFVERSGGALVDLESVRRAAELVPNGRYVEVPGDDLLPFFGDPDPMLGEIEEFLTGERTVVDPDRALATVLFTDIVGSTLHAGSAGDHKWRHVLDSHHQEVRRSLAQFGGVEVDTAGDGFLATFDGPARAVRCACFIRDAVRRIGLDIRAGLHTGEVERRDRSIAGLAVHIGARVAAVAEASEVLVTDTVKALVIGSGIAFGDRGMHHLKGVPDEWHLFRVEEP